MTYRETLNKARENKIEAIKLNIANELDYFINCEELELDEEQFETACELVEEAYIESEVLMTVWALVRTLVDKITEEGTEVLNDTWYKDLIQQATYYL